MSLPKSHITWGGENIHHLENVPEMDDDEGYNFFENTTGNTALHELLNLVTVNPSNGVLQPRTPRKCGTW